MAALGSNFTYCSEGPFDGSPLTTMKCAPGTTGFSDHLPWSVFQYLAPDADFAAGFPSAFAASSCAHAAASRHVASSNTIVLIHPPRFDIFQIISAPTFSGIAVQSSSRSVL